MKAGVDSNQFITVLIYVVLIGGGIVSEIVKQIRKRQAQRQLEEQLASGRMPQQPNAEIIEEREVEEDEEEEERKPREVETPRDAKEMFEQIFGPPPSKKSPMTFQVRQLAKVIKTEVTEVNSEEPQEGSLVKLQRLQEFKGARFEPIETVAVSEPIPVEKRIFKDLRLSDMQKLVVYSEIFGKPKALKRRRI